jgi:hypothetical protein
MEVMFFSNRRFKKSRFLVLFLIPLSSYADIDHTKLKGLHRLLDKNYQQLSPVYGFNLLKKGIIENLFRFGPSEDANVKLIRSMFHTVDEVNFGITRLPSNVATHLDTKAIGGLLAELSKDDATGLDARLIARIQQYLGLSESGSESTSLTKKEKQILRKKTREFVGILLAAIQESSGPARSYPRYFPEHILLSFFWAKASDNKSEFLDLFEQYPEYLTQKGNELLSDSDKRSDWEQKVYTPAEYYTLTKPYRSGALPWKSGEDLISQSPEITAFLAYSYSVWDAFLPPLVSYETTDYYRNGKTENFADCGETSIRNFFNIVLKNPVSQKLDATYLKEAALKENLNLNLKLVAFYEKNFSLSGLSTRRIHSDWAAVVSRLPKVAYRQPMGRSVESRYCNITGGFDSVMSVFSQLLFPNDPSFEKSKRVVQMDRLMKYFSRPGFTLEWSFDGKKSDLNKSNVGFTIVFLVNGSSSFKWRFSPGHFVVDQMRKNVADWRTELGPRLAAADAKYFTSANRAHDEKAAGLTWSKLSWFVFPDNLDEVISKFDSIQYPKGDFQFLLWSYPFSNQDKKIQVIQNIVRNNWIRLYPYTVELLAQLSDQSILESGLLAVLEDSGDEALTKFVENYRARSMSMIRITN